MKSALVSSSADSAGRRACELLAGKGVALNIVRGEGPPLAVSSDPLNTAPYSCWYLPIGFCQSNQYGKQGSDLALFKRLQGREVLILPTQTISNIALGEKVAMFSGKGRWEM